MKAKAAGFGETLQEKVMRLRKFITPRTRSWLVEAAAALGVALMLTGCVVEAQPSYGYREHWHGWHEWR